MGAERVPRSANYSTIFTTVCLWYDVAVAVEQSFPHPLADPLADVIAQRFRVLAEPTRIKLLDRLREGDATVSQLQAALGASQQNVSKHLGILDSAGMVARAKDGNHVRYSIAIRASSSSATWSAAASAARSTLSTRSSSACGMRTRRALRVWNEQRTSAELDGPPSQTAIRPVRIQLLDVLGRRTNREPPQHQGRT